jgi:hypothetical protein
VVYYIMQPKQRAKNTSMYDAPLSLPSQNLLDLTDLFLNFAGYLFGFAFALQLGIIDDFPGHFLDFTLCFVKLAFCFLPSPSYLISWYCSLRNLIWLLALQPQVTLGVSNGPA